MNRPVEKQQLLTWVASAWPGQELFRQVVTGALVISSSVERGGVRLWHAAGSRDIYLELPRLLGLLAIAHRARSVRGVKHGRFPARSELSPCHPTRPDACVAAVATRALGRSGRRPGPARDEELATSLPYPGPVAAAQEERRGAADVHGTAPTCLSPSRLCLAS